MAHLKGGCVAMGPRLGKFEGGGKGTNAPCFVHSSTSLNYQHKLGGGTWLKILETAHHHQKKKKDKKKNLENSDALSKDLSEENY